MKKIILYTIVILTCSCHQGTDRSHPVSSDDSNRRLEEVRQMMRSYYKRSLDSGVQVDFEVRGPLTLAQVEKELFERYMEILKDASTQNERLDINFAETESLRKLKSTYKDGDELYFFTSDEPSWAYLLGIKGYVIIRKNKVFDTIVTAIN